ncbi:MAG: hypothetical protein NTW28_25680 [Candidatus Solibacter sp.]|nr:hypothetical protein [Candidatus Solibacter sp.]
MKSTEVLPDYRVAFRVYACERSADWHQSPHETEGGHTWTNWRHYLSDFDQLLFG